MPLKIRTSSISTAGSKNTPRLLFFSLFSRNESMSWMWLYTVIHANLSVWIWLGYFIFTYNYCWQEIASLKCPDCSTVACTGGIFLGKYSFQIQFTVDFTIFLKLSFGK